jgi:hypothetical protein
MNACEAAQRLVPEACEELLSSTGHRCRRLMSGDLAALSARPDEYAAGIVDFGGDVMAGSLVLLSAFEFFAAALAPPRLPDDTKRGSLRPQSAADWIRVRDWSMEMSNQLLGRIRNQLRKLGVVLEPQLPRAVSGHALLVTVRGRASKPHVYLTAPHEVFVWFDATAKDSVTGASIQVVPEGGVVEF